MRWERPLQPAPTWYAAHIVTYIQFLDGSQDSYPIWENVVLIEAESDERVSEEAERIGKQVYEMPEDEMFSEGRPAMWIFAGVRKIIECRDTSVKTIERSDIDPRPGYGTEATYSKMRVDSKEALEQLVQGEPVTVVYEE